MTTKLMLAVSALATALLAIAPAKPDAAAQAEAPAFYFDDVADDAELVEKMLAGAETDAQLVVVEG